MLYKTCLYRFFCDLHWFLPLNIGGTSPLHEAYLQIIMAKHMQRRLNHTNNLRYIFRDFAILILFCSKLLPAAFLHVPTCSRNVLAKALARHDYNDAMCCDDNNKLIAGRANAAGEMGAFGATSYTSEDTKDNIRL